jgi:hypothetical protein
MCEEYTLGEMRCAQKIFAGKPEQKEVVTHERIVLKLILAIWWVGMNCFTITDNMNWCQFVANKIMDL